jgi:hypothetical protein
MKKKKLNLLQDLPQDLPHVLAVSRLTTRHACIVDANTRKGSERHFVEGCQRCGRAVAGQWQGSGGKWQVLASQGKPGQARAKKKGEIKIAVVVRAALGRYHHYHPSVVHRFRVVFHANWYLAPSPDS